MRKDKYLDIWWIDCCKCSSSVCTKPSCSQEEAADVAKQAGYRETIDGWVCPRHK